MFFPNNRKIRITVGLHKFCSGRCSAVMLRNPCYCREQAWPAECSWIAKAITQRVSGGRSGAALPGKARREQRRGTMTQVGSRSLWQAAQSSAFERPRRAGWLLQPVGSSASWPSLSLGEVICPNRLAGNQEGTQENLCSAGLSLPFIKIFFVLSNPFPGAREGLL